MFERLGEGHLRDSGLGGKVTRLERGCTLENFHGGGFVKFDPVTDTLQFKGQLGPVKENGENGAQVDDLIRLARAVVLSLDEAFPCAENKECLKSLDEAVGALLKRSIRRGAAGIEGTEAEEAPPAEESSPEKPAEDDPSDGA